MGSAAISARPKPALRVPGGEPRRLLLQRVDRRQRAQLLVDVQPEAEHIAVLDLDANVNGLTPRSQAEIVTQALADDVEPDALDETLDTYDVRHHTDEI